MLISSMEQKTSIMAVYDKALTMITEARVIYSIILILFHALTPN